MTRFNSPGVYTSEKDLDLKKTGNQISEAVESNNSGGVTNPTKKPIFWVLRCGFWDDEGTWLSYARWQDDLVWPCE